MSDGDDIKIRNDQYVAASLYSHGLSVDEIAKRMKVKPAWVEALLEREKERLMRAEKARSRGA